MFEKYGVLDFFCGIRKYFKIVLLVCLVGFLCGIGFGLIQQTQMEHDGSGAEDAVNYSNSNSFYFTYFDIEDIGENGVAYLKQVASSARNYVESDFARQHVCEYLDQTYGRQDMLRLFQENDPEFLEEDYDLEYLRSFLTCKVLDDGVTVNYWITSRHEDLTDRLLEAYGDYVSYLKTDIYSDLRFVELGGAKQMKTDAELEIEGGSEQSDSTQRSPVTKGVLLLLIAGVLAAMVIFFYTLIVPRMNRKSDFTSYEIPVLGELSKNHAKKKQLVDSQQCLRIMNALENKRIVALTSSIDEDIVHRTAESLQNIAAKEYCILQYDSNELDYRQWIDTQLADTQKKYLVLLPSVSVFETALQVASAADAVLLAEYYGETTYKNFERTIELSNEYHLKLKGVIALY